MKKTSKRKLFWIFAIGIIVSFALKINSETKNYSCVTKTETFTVRGKSMVGIVDEGKKVKILYGYYGCNPAQKGDVVAYNYSGNPNLIIKTVWGVPGDVFKLRMDNGKWEIMLNNNILANSNNQPYLLDNGEAKMLKLYEKDYQGKIPLDTYLILGNITRGSLDSTRFGLVSKDDIAGKVEY